MTLILVLGLVAALVTYHALRTADDGWEDSDGYHQ